MDTCERFSDLMGEYKALRQRLATARRATESDRQRRFRSFMEDSRSMVIRRLHAASETIALWRKRNPDLFGRDFDLFRVLSVEGRELSYTAFLRWLFRRADIGLDYATATLSKVRSRSAWAVPGGRIRLEAVSKLPA